MVVGNSSESVSRTTRNPAVGGRVHTATSTRSGLIRVARPSSALRFHLDVLELPPRMVERNGQELAVSSSFASPAESRISTPNSWALRSCFPPPPRRPGSWSSSKPTGDLSAGRLDALLGLVSREPGEGAGKHKGLARKGPLLTGSNPLHRRETNAELPQPCDLCPVS